MATFAGLEYAKDYQPGHSCPICHRCELRESAPLSSLAPTDDDYADSIENSVKGLITTLLRKVANIESKMTKLDDLAPVKTQLSRLETGMRQSASSLSELARKTDALSTRTDDLSITTLELRNEQMRLDKRLCALKKHPAPCSARDGLELRLEVRLEALKRTRLNTELILFGVKELAG